LTCISLEIRNYYKHSGFQLVTPVRFPNLEKDLKNTTKNNKHYGYKRGSFRQFSITLCVCVVHTKLNFST